MKHSIKKSCFTYPFMLYQEFPEFRWMFSEILLMIWEKLSLTHSIFLESWNPHEYLIYFKYFRSLEHFDGQSIYNFDYLYLIVLVLKKNFPIWLFLTFFSTAPYSKVVIQVKWFFVSFPSVDFVLIWKYDYTRSGWNKVQFLYI